MLFSVAVPVFNTEKYVAKCIESVLNQTCQDFELILVNDGSTDRSSLICEQAAAKHPQKVRYFAQENQGPLAARIRAIKEAAGDYVVVLDSDDSLRLDALENIAASIDYCETDVICFGMSRREDFSKCENWVFPNYEHGKIPINLVRRAICKSPAFNSIWGKAIKRELFLKASAGLEGLRLSMAEDLLQLMHLIELDATFSLCKLPLYYYRQNEESTTRTFHPSNLSDVDYVYGKLLDASCKWDSADPSSSAFAASTALYVDSLLAQSISNSLSLKSAMKELNIMFEKPVFNKACRLYKPSVSAYSLPVRAYTWLLINKMRMALIAVSRARAAMRS